MTRPAVLLAVLTLLASGCGFLVNGTARHVPVRSSPPGAEVWVDGRYAGLTPLRVDADPDIEHRIEIRARGYATQRFLLRSQLSVLFVILDVLLTAGVGLVVDAVTDGWDVPELDSVEATLEEHRTERHDP